jgi:transcription initiation factor TFIID subunit 3
MSDSELFFSLLRITSAQILRAAGLTTAKPSVVDAFTGRFHPLPPPPPKVYLANPIEPLVDIVARYLMLLGTTTRDMAESSGRLQAELDDVRLALEHVGLVRPLNIFNDPYDDDTRGVDALIEWFRGPQAAEMRRVAGFAVTTKEGEQQQQQQQAVEAAAKGEEWAAGKFSSFSFSSFLLRNFWVGGLFTTRCGC